MLAQHIEPALFHLLDVIDHGLVSGRGIQPIAPDMRDTVDLLYNTVSLAVWVPFNEGWGQFDSLLATPSLSYNTAIASINSSLVRYIR